MTLTLTTTWRKTSTNKKITLSLANENSKWKKTNCLKRGKTRLLLILNLIGWDDCTGFLNQSEGKVKTKAIPNYFGHSLWCSMHVIIDIPKYSAFMEHLKQRTSTLRFIRRWHSIHNSMVTSTLTGTAIENVNESKTLLVTWNKNVKLILMPILMHCWSHFPHCQHYNDDDASLICDSKKTSLESLTTFAS